MRAGRREVKIPGPLLRAGGLLPAAFCLAAAGATNIMTRTNGALPAALRDIKGPVAIPSLLLWLIRLAVAAALAGLLWLGWWWWQRRRAKVEPIPTVPPDRRARERLAQALALIDRPERFCTAVSEITRTYLEERFGLRAPDQTTEEFLAELPRSALLDRRHKQPLTDFLTRCDLVKFARFEPVRAELEELHAAALKLVEETVPMAAPAGVVPPRLPPPPPRPPLTLSQP